MITQVIVSIERDDGVPFDIKMSEMELQEKDAVEFFAAIGEAVKQTPKLKGASDGV